MNPGFWILLAACAGGGVAFAGLPASAAAQPPRAWPTLAGLAGLIAALLAVGVVSGTPIRHVVQVSAASVALLVAWRSAAIGRAAALPAFTVWLGVMTAIWLHLLGVTSLVRGRFTSTEITLTLAIGAACAIGLIGGARPAGGLTQARRVGIAVLSAAAQVLALWLSLQPPVVAR